MRVLCSEERIASPFRKLPKHTLPIILLVFYYWTQSQLYTLVHFSSL